MQRMTTEEDNTLINDSHLHVNELGDIVHGGELEEALSREVRNPALARITVGAPLLTPLLGLSHHKVVVVAVGPGRGEVVVDLVEHEVRHLTGVPALGPRVGGGTVTLRLSVVLDANTLKYFFMNYNKLKCQFFPPNRLTLEKKLNQRPNLKRCF